VRVYAHARARQVCVCECVCACAWQIEDKSTAAWLQWLFVDLLRPCLVGEARRAALMSARQRCLPAYPAAPCSTCVLWSTQRTIGIGIGWAADGLPLQVWITFGDAFASKLSVEVSLDGTSLALLWLGPIYQPQGPQKTTDRLKVANAVLVAGWSGSTAAADCQGTRQCGRHAMVDRRWQRRSSSEAGETRALPRTVVDRTVGPLDPNRLLDSTVEHSDAAQLGRCLACRDPSKMPR
jgi:hypothetical protein